jgi:hypothetical protein
MRFLYKIWSGYDWFIPAAIPERLAAPDRLELGWRRYLDVARTGDEVWVYFHGPGGFDPGVYVKGRLVETDTVTGRAALRVDRYSTDRSLTDPSTTRRIAEAVAAKGLQVFLFPERWRTAPECSVDTDASSCGARECASCPTWRRLPRIWPGAVGWPVRLSESYEEFAPAYWVIPSRCYLPYEGKVPSRGVRRTSDLFYRFKLGEENLAYPLALGLHRVLKRRRLVTFDCVVPIPLSPDKEEAGEIHRAHLLADELATLLDTRVCELLALRHDISKYQLQTVSGLSPREYEEAYKQALQVADEVAELDQVLIVDDVCTKGSTLTCALEVLREANPGLGLVAASAGQMILKAVVEDEDALVAS